MASSTEARATSLTNTANEPPLPVLTSIAPAMFVPITTDLLAPFSPPPNRVARLRAILAEIDTHAAGVRANLVALFDRERERLVRDARATDAQETQDRAKNNLPPGRDVGRGMSGDDTADMIAKMEAPVPSDPAWSCNIVEVGVPTFTSAGARSSREWAALETMDLMSRSSWEIIGFEKHIKKTKDFYEQALEKELEREAE